MSELTQELRNKLSLYLDSLEMASFNSGFEAAVNGIDELSNAKHNQGDLVASEVLSWTSRELRGENIDNA
jgi:hypothetical protein